MAQQLTTGLNFFELSGAVDVIGSNIPTDFNTQGIAKQNGETGFFVRSDKNYTLYIYYSTGGWVEYGSVDVTDEDYGTGVSIPWLEDLSHGLPMAAYFVTSESEHELRIFSKRGRISADLLPGNSDINKDTLVHSLADTAIDDDGKITGRSTIAEFSVDTTLFAGGDTVTFSTDGDFWYGHVLVNAQHELPANISYDAASDQTQVTFELPNIHDSSHDRYSIHLSLKESVPAVQKFILTANTYVIDENGEVTITLSTQNVAAGTTLPWTISGTGIDSNDFSQGDFLDATALTGEFVVGTTDSVSFTMEEDLTTEGSEVFTLSLDGGQANVSIVVNDTSTTPAAAATHGLKMAVIVGDDNYGDGSLQYRLGGRGNYTEINWGDGNTSTYSNTGEQSYDSIAHTYSTPGTYIVEVKGSGSIIPNAANHLNTKWNRTGMPLYDVTYDTGNVGPFGMNKPAIELDFSTVTNLSVSGTTMTITDSANTDWASIVTGASYSDAIGGAMQIQNDSDRYWSEITSAVTSGDTTTITIANGSFYAESVGVLEDAISDDGATVVIGDLITYPIQMTLRPDLNQHPNFQVKHASYPLGKGMWDLDRNLPTVSHARKFTQITHWGTDFTHTNINNQRTSFENCRKMDITATDSPDFTNCTTLANMFNNCHSLVDSNNTLNTNTFVGTHTTICTQIFYNCKLYNNDLTNWETENVQKFHRTFEYAELFNGDISNWRLDSCDDIQKMFWRATSFNCPINTTVRGDGYLAWDVSNVVYFLGALGFTSFNQDVSNWNVSSTGSLRELFRDSPFNQDLITQEVTVGGNTYVAWNVSDVVSFDFMFYNTNNFNGDVSNWDTSNSATFKYMFQANYYFNQNIDTHSVTVPGVGTYDAWDVKRRAGNSHSDKFEAMFYNAFRFNQDLNNWDTSDAVDMFGMFYNAKMFNGNISSWDVSNVKYPNEMFRGAYSFNSDISGWNTSNFLTMRYMFNDAYSFDQDLNSWDVSNVSSFFFTFRRARIKVGITGNWNFNNWNTSSATTLEGMFYQWTPGVSPDLTAYGGSVIQTASSQWHPIVTNWDVSNVTTMYRMFHTFVNLDGIDFSNWNPASLTSAADMFQQAHNFTGGGFTTLNFPLLKSINGCFWATSLPNVDVANLGSSGNLNNIANCFRNLIGDVFTGTGLEHWDISAVTSLSHLFTNSSNNFNGDVTNWNTSNVTSFQKAFYGCPGFNRDISQWNTSKLVDALYAFYQTTSLDFSPAGWDVSKLTNGLGMFSNSGAATWDQARVDAVMAGWGAQTVQNDVSLTIDAPSGNALGVPTSGAGLTGYNNLVNNYNWTITIS